MIAILLILSLLIPVNTPIIEEPIQINSVEIREVETPARFFGKEVIEDDWYAIFWSNEIEKPVSIIRVALPKGETIKISAWDGSYPDGKEYILYKGNSGDMDTEANVPCTQIAVYSTGEVEELRISVCYADIQ